MKLGIAAKMALTVGAILMGIALLSEIGEQSLSKVYELTDNVNINLVPSIFSHQAYARHRP
jgi:hypothetical protein